MKKKIILGLKIEKREELSTQVQHILTKYGCSIKTRIGLHDIENEDDNSTGIILLECCGDQKQIALLESELLSIETIELQKMYFAIRD